MTGTTRHSPLVRREPIYGAQRAQPVATGGKWDDPENRSNKPIRNRSQPTATVRERMVKRTFATACHRLPMIPYLLGRGSTSGLRKEKRVPRTRRPAGLDENLTDADRSQTPARSFARVEEVRRTQSCVGSRRLRLDAISAEVFARIGADREGVGGRSCRGRSLIPFAAPRWAACGMLEWLGLGRRSRR
jgi:hypothetical protein